MPASPIAPYPAFSVERTSQRSRVSIAAGRGLTHFHRPRRAQYKLPTDNRFAQMEDLRAEIRQAENTRSDLLKWKLGLVGAIGAAGLGFAGSVEVRHADLVLCALPPVAIYVDLLALHLTLRIMVIGSYFRTPGAAAAHQGYEHFVHDARSPGGGPSPFDLEDWALFYSTYALSAAVAVYGVYQLLVEGSAFGIPFVLSGTIGAGAEFLGSREYTGRRDALEASKPPAAGDGA